VQQRNSWSLPRIEVLLNEIVKIGVGLFHTGTARSNLGGAHICNFW
jgi:hypothetical protein